MKNPALRIADATPAHLQQIAELEKICFSAPWTQQTLSSHLGDGSHVLLVALDGGFVAGYAGFMYVLDEGNITNVAVAPEYRRQGLGGALVDALMRRAEGLHLAFLTLEVRESNEAARSIYASRGFRDVGRRKNYYEKPTEDAILMTRNFSQETPGVS